MELILDVVYQILLRVPVKTLIKFQCVSKKWLSLISDPSFRQDHYCRRSQQEPLFLFTKHKFEKGSTRSDPRSALHISTYDNQGNFVKNFSRTATDLPPCSHGTVSYQDLVCIVPQKPKYCHRLFICNPSTEELVALPPAQEASRSLIGFGHAASTKELKLVRFFRPPNSNGYDGFLCEIFTLANNRWREARSPPKYDFFCTSGATFIHGAFHLLPDYMIDDIDGSMDNGIVAFDIDSEEYTKIPLPQYYSTPAAYSAETVNLDVFGVSLFLNFDFKTRTEFWCLKDYDAGEWSKEYIIDLSSFGSDVWIDRLEIMGDGRLMLSNMKDGKSATSVYFYNFKDKSLRKIMKKDGTLTLYVDSFLSLDHRYVKSG